MDVKQRIKAIIDSRDDLTVRGVSLKAGLSDSALHKYLTKPAQSMTIDNLERVAEAMGVTLRSVLFNDEERENILSIWDRIPSGKRSTAREMLEGIAKRA